MSIIYLFCDVAPSFKIAGLWSSRSSMSSSRDSLDILQPNNTSIEEDDSDVPTSPFDEEPPDTPTSTQIKSASQAFGASAPGANSPFASPVNPPLQIHPLDIRNKQQFVVTSQNPSGGAPTRVSPLLETKLRHPNGALNKHSRNASSMPEIQTVGRTFGSGVAQHPIGNGSCMTVSPVAPPRGVRTGNGGAWVGPGGGGGVGGVMTSSQERVAEDSEESGSDTTQKPPIRYCNDLPSPLKSPYPPPPPQPYKSSINGRLTSWTSHARSMCMFYAVCAQIYSIL